MSANNRVKSSANPLRCKDSSHFSLAPQPKSVIRPKLWNEEVEEAYRFQVAGYRDEKEYKAIQNVLQGMIDATIKAWEGIVGGNSRSFFASFQSAIVDRWPSNGFVKKLQRRDGTYYYFNKARECEDKDVRRTKIYAY